MRFTSGDSYNPDGSIINYPWDFGDSISFSTETNPTHTFENRGTYLIVLTVTDDNGQSTSSAPLEINVRKSRGKRK